MKQDDGFDPSHDWQRLYRGLCEMRPDGRFPNEEIAFDLVLAGFIESREVRKPCRNCGTSLLDYRFNRMTVAGRMFKEAAAIAMDAQPSEPQS